MPDSRINAGQLSVQADVMQYFMQSASIPLIAFDREGVLAYFNTHVAEVLQVNPHILESCNVMALLNTRDKSIFRTHIDRVINDKQSSRCEIEIIFPEANRQTIRLISHPGVQDQDRILCWSSLESLTQIRRLEKTEALYQRAAEIIGKADSLKDFSHQLFELLRILFGIENGYVAIRDSQTGMIHFPYFVDKKDPSPEARKPANGMTDYVITMGRLAWLHDARSESSVTTEGFQFLGTTPTDWIGVPLAGKDRIVGMVAILTHEKGQIFSTKDIGLMLGVGRLLEVFMNRIELEESQHLLSAAIEQAAESVMITDVRGHILYVNPAFENLTGYSRNQVVGKTPAVIQSGKHDPEFYREMWKVLSAGETWRGRFINRRKDGELYEEDAVISPVRNKNGQVVNYVAVKRDITHETRLERQFLHAQKMEAAGKLVESIHHDFSNLLMVVRTNADYLLNQADNVKLDRNELDQIIHATDRGDELIRQLSGFSSGETDEPELENVNALLQEFVSTAKNLAGQEYEIRLDLAPRMDTIRANRGHVEQLLANLVINAADAMPDGGVIVLRSLMSAIRKEDKTNFADKPPADQHTYAVIEVEDQGPGIPPELIPEIFKSEYSTKNKDKGAGLGLPTSLEIMREHKGYIGVRNNLPVGSVFRLFFPATSAAAHEPVLLTQPIPEVPRGSETIILAEDDEGARRVISRMLQDQGYTILEAENGAMAIRYMLSHPQKIHLLLSDMMMPDFDGWALSEQVLGLQPGIKVIFVSGYNQAEIEEKGVNLSGRPIPLLSKPFRREELLNLVRRVLDTD